MEKVVLSSLALLFLVLFFRDGVSAYKLIVHTKGEPWPMPKSYKPTPTQQSLNKETFKFVVAGNDCDLLRSAFRRYYKIIFYPGWENEPASLSLQKDNTLRFEPRHGKQFLRKGAAGEAGVKKNGAYHDMPVLATLSVNVMSVCEDYPSLGMDESYTLNVGSGAAKLSSQSIWGALRGLETFSQIIYDTDNNLLVINNTVIDDAPRFPHRGAMLDTARHYLPKIVLLQNLDAMAYNKLNVFHWHIVDDESFPYQSRVFPKLSEDGAWEPYTHIYTQEDIADVIEYARMRGIRVIPEFDTPGHSQSWGKGYPELLTQCYSKGKPDGTTGPLDPSKENTYTFLKSLFTELKSVFKDHYVHLGGDEVSFSCWQSNPNITAFMKANNITGYPALESHYEQRLLDIVNGLDSGYLVWQEVVDNGCKVRADTVVHVWINFQSELDKVTKLGLRTVLSTPWYLNYISYGSDWQKYYKVEPLSFNGTDAQNALVMGGELAMWGEYVDGSNVISRIWPRGSAVAERLWSPQNVNDTTEAESRLEEHRCRLIRRGLSAQPVRPDTVCHVWKDGWQKELEKTTAQGLTSILSAPWYLNYISYGSVWEHYYNVEPCAFNGTQKQKSLVMGGEACLWGEYVDGTNAMSRFWPHAGAVAERLWSPVHVNSSSQAKGRMEEHRCRLVRRGIKAEPNFPSFCKYEYRPTYIPQV